MLFCGHASKIFLEMPVLEAHREKDVLIIKITEPKLQMYIIPNLRSMVKDCLADKPPCVVFDLSQVELFDSSAMGAFFGFQKNIQGWGGRMRLANLSTKLQQIFKVTKTENSFSIYATVDDALRDWIS